MHAGHRPDHARDAPAGADDHLAVDLLAQDPVGRADVVLALGRDGRGLEPEPGLAHGLGGLGDDGVVGLAAVLEREVVVDELGLEPGDVGVEHADRLLEQLLPGLVALEDDDLEVVGHGRAEPTRVRVPRVRGHRREALLEPGEGRHALTHAATAGCSARGTPASSATWT